MRETLLLEQQIVVLEKTATAKKIWVYPTLLSSIMNISKREKKLLSRVGFGMRAPRQTNRKISVTPELNRLELCVKAFNYLPKNNQAPKLQKYLK